jgi:hypothetical protein
MKERRIKLEQYWGINYKALGPSAGEKSIDRETIAKGEHESIELKQNCKMH